MRGRELADASRTKTGPSPRNLNRQGEKKDVEAVPSYQRDPLAQLLSPVGGANPAAIHASWLSQVTAVQPSRARSSLLHLQRQRGNRYVQRVVSIYREGAGGGEVGPEVEQAIHSQRGSGHSLDRGIRSTMEPVFGADFSQVRVHTDAQADTLNRTLSARAFTTGRDIFFRQGEYRPGSSTGKELITHELTHVVQQGGAGVQAKLTVSQPGDPYEQQADQVASEVMRQRIARQSPDEEEEGMIGMKPMPGVATNVFR
jgi:Domain of unknown function (DUF4157)